ncbi:MAG: CotH kinase family protein [Cryomorphaceae bacterium]|nr:CotH kinase family protein [Cryomorphaceae bacterium]
MTGQVTPPTFSHFSGFYDSLFFLEISHPDTAAEIIYTTNGSIPTRSNLQGKQYYYKNGYEMDPGQPSGPLVPKTYYSYAYQNPIIVADATLENNDISNISTTYFPFFAAPTYQVPKATVIRARAYLGNDSSQVITRTFFIQSENNHQYSLPVISLSLNEESLFDYFDGIYVAGWHFDRWRRYNPTAVAWGKVEANWARRGTEAEVPAYFQFFHDETEKLGQNIGVRIHGGWSRSYRQKTLRLYARNAYDTQNTFNFPFFGEHDDDSFKRLMLRNSGQDYDRTFFRDALMQKLVAHLSFFTQSYQPSIVYINGEFWGLHNIRTRYDKHFFERKLDLMEDEIDYLTSHAEVKLGDTNHYLVMFHFVENNDLSVEENYKTLDTLIDIENYTDYMISQAFINNRDWPVNIDYYRKRTSKYDPDAPYGHDGRWRWMLFDTDFGFGLYRDYQNDMIKHLTSDDLETERRLILKKLLENQTYKFFFINRFSDLINTTFTTERTLQLIEKMQGQIAGDIHHQKLRYGHDPDHWNRRVEVLRDFARNRPEAQWAHLKDFFNLENLQEVRLDVSDERLGYIHLNTLDICAETVGVEGYPWKGKYFQDVPIALTAKPLPGCQFIRWSGDVNGVNPQITVLPKNVKNIKAHFEFIDTVQLLHFWYFNAEVPNNTPLKSMHTSYSFNRQWGNISFESCLPEYPYHFGHPLWRKASMERRNAPTPLNYFPEGNSDLPYDGQDMRGIQIRQPFSTHLAENTLIFNFSTKLFKEISLSLAVLDEEIIESIKVDYFDLVNGRFSNANLFDSIITFGESSTYNRVKIDFSHVSNATNADTLQVRFRFREHKPFADDGKRITFNNIAVQGRPILNPTDTLSKVFEKQSFPYVVYPNPTQNMLFVASEHRISRVWLFNLLGQEIFSETPKYFDFKRDISQLKPGRYVLRLMFENGHSESSVVIVH